MLKIAQQFKAFGSFFKIRIRKNGKTKSYSNFMIEMYNFKTTSICYRTIGVIIF